MRISLLVALTVASPFWLSQSANAMPRCESVLLPAEGRISSEAIESSIRDLAKLKMSLDLSKVAGAESAVAVKMMNSHYLEKYDELVRELQSRISEAKIRKMLLTQIKGLQKIRERETRYAAQVRNEQGAFRLPVKYILEKTIEVSEPFANLRYIPELDSLVVRSDIGPSLQLLDLKAQGSVMLQKKNISYAISPDSSQIVMLSYSGQLKFFDLKKNQIENESAEGLFQNLDADSKVSSQGIVASRSSDGRRVVLQDRNGQNLKVAPEFSTFGFVADFWFINAHELLIARSSEDRIYIFDTNTGITREIKTPYRYSYAQITPEGDKVFLTASEGFSVFEINNTDLSIDYPKTSFSVAGLLGGGLAYGSRKSANGQIEELYDLDEMTEPRPEHSYLRPVGRILGVAVDLKGGRSFISTTANPGIKHFIEVWKRVILKKAGVGTKGS